MNTIEALDTRWNRTMFPWLYRWHANNGVFSYALEVDENANTFTVIVERVDAGSRKKFGPYKHHYNATAAVVAHFKEGTR